MTGSHAPGEGRPRPGAGKEDDIKTTLAWERTAMALLVVAVATARHTWSLLGPAALLPVAGLMALTAWVLAEGWRRYDDDRDYRHYRAIGGPTLMLAATTVLMATIELIHLLAP
ncbi:DUF202 domain-containing protein [Nocardioides sp. cx-173]|uniref:DUF202 domain-containing protein n=1 Tax=Nocardioides sp. cx-173 TaxID=2898796 RepID=UPI001E4BA2CD|nr:DUF202 domain-containing protein [Nocardioides sp. cx-173]MCD4526878.1 DUF202 domain-containing protein [Nocardioides sp. cx-173]UGB41333.1 DUF202 domain-containing protein [Nocardioides sp. cx-173]